MSHSCLCFYLLTLFDDSGPIGDGVSNNAMLSFTLAYLNKIFVSPYIYYNFESMLGKCCVFGVYAGGIEIMTRFEPAKMLYATGLYH